MLLFSWEVDFFSKFTTPLKYSIKKWKLKNHHAIISWFFWRSQWKKRNPEENIVSDSPPPFHASLFTFCPGRREVRLLQTKIEQLVGRLSRRPEAAGDNWASGRSAFCRIYNFSQEVYDDSRWKSVKLRVKSRKKSFGISIIQERYCKGRREMESCTCWDGCWWGQLARRSRRRCLKFF